MHTTDIERIRAQISRTADKAEEIIEDADTIGDSGFDPRQSDNILQQQRELVEELAQSIADFNELLNRAEEVESNPIKYVPKVSSLSVSYDSESSEITVEYTGDDAVPNDEITVTEAGTDVSLFNGDDVTNGTVVTRDVSGLSDGDEFVVELVQHRVKDCHRIKSWSEVLGKQGETAPLINSGDLQLPEHNLTENSKTLTRSVVIGQQSV